MVDLDASQQTARQLNRRIKKLARRGEEINILNPRALHNIAVGVLRPCKIHIDGSVGYYAATMLDGPEVTIVGNAGWGLGENMMSGKIALARDAGASAGSSMRGGEIFVGGSAGARAGISMKGGTLIVRGDTGFMTGFMMQKGRIIVCGDVGDAVGDSMYEGAIYVAGSIGSLGNDAEIVDVSEDELIDIWGALEGYGVDERPRFTKIVSSKKLYHFDSLERLEKTVI
mgnify:CR=1 FL=1